MLATLGLMLALLYGPRFLGSAPQPWTDLARGFEPRPLAEVVANLERAAGRTPELSFAGLGIALRQAYEPGDWRPEAVPGRFVAPLPRGAFRHAGEALRLEIADHALLRVEDPAALAPDRFAFDGERVHVQLGPDEGAPAAELVGRLENGKALEGVWSLRLGQCFAPGIPVWSGGREELQAAVAAGSRLDFRFVFGGLQRAGVVRYRVLLDGAVLVERECSAEEAAAGRFESTVLPPEARRRARFAFEFDGPTGLGAFFTPRLAPVAIGTPGARPWPETRPDLVLFLADTFRADNLSLYGGQPSWTPELDRLAGAGRRFLEARSVAAWTLPSISTLLTGLQPAFHGAVEQDSLLREELETLPERLARAGYRVGAVTDGSFFSPSFGLQQGFEWFTWREEPGWSTARTLAEARDFLARDDGRPTFLVVHTYRTHQPYRRGPQEDAGEYRAIEALQRAEAGSEAPPIDVVRRLALKYQEPFRDLYRDGVRDLDRVFGELFASLEAQRFFEHGYLLFTSDHGEALGEHGDMFHGGHLWEEKLRVPLVLWGPDLAPGDVAAPASLIDVPLTLNELAGLPRPEGWMGNSLLRLPADRPSFAFQLTERSRQVALVRGGRKVILTPDEERLSTGNVEEAYDLRADPGEAHNLAADEDWPGRMTREMAPVLLEFTTLHGPGATAEVSPELAQQLRNLGYGQ